MGKVIQKQIQGMSWWMKASLVLLLTLASTIFMYEGWYKPKAAMAALTQLVAPTVVSVAGAPGTTSVTVGGTAGTNRMLIVGVALKSATLGAATCSATYNGVSMIPVPNTDAGAGAGYGHTFWFYQLDASLPTTAANLVVTAGGTTPAQSSVWYAAYSGADQVAPSGQNSNSGTGAVSSAALNSPLTISTGDYAYDVIALVRSGSTTARTLSTWATGWAIIGTQVNNTVTPGSNFYLGQSTTANAADSASHGTSGTTQISASAVVVPMLPSFKVANGTDPASGYAYQGSTALALDGFSMKMGSGTGTVSTLTLTGSAGFINTNVSAIRIYRDTGTLGVLDGDVQVASTTAWASNVATITFTTAESVTTTAANYLVVIDVAAAAAPGALLSGTITAATGTGLGTDLRYLDAGSANYAVRSSGLYVGEQLGSPNASAPQGSLDNPVNGFKLFMGNGSSTVSTLTLTGSTQFTAANVAAIKVYRDSRGIGRVDTMDELVPTTTAWAANVATITFTTAEPVYTTARAYLVAVDLAAGAAVGNTLSGTITAATGTGLGTVSYKDKRSATLTVSTGAALTVGNSTNPANVNAPAASKNYAVDAFSLNLGAAAVGKVNTLTLTGNANFTTANIAALRIFADNGTVGTLDRYDTLIPSTYTHTGTAPVVTFTTPEAVSNKVKNYLVVVDINPQPQATVTNTLTATVTAVTGSGYIGTPTYSDTASATLTIAKSAFANTACSDCHGYGSATAVFPDATTRNTPKGNFVGSHQTHNGQYAYACSDCHSIPATETSADFGHSRGTIVMAAPIHAETGAAYGKGTSWAYTDAPTAGQACSNLYCHSQGAGKTSQAGDTRSVSAPVIALNWGTNAVDNCDSCHGYPPSYANGATTWGAAKANSHAVHSTDCQVCHKTTTANGTIVNTAVHANGVYNVISSGSSGITPRRSFTYTYAVTGGTCANISCHGGRTDVWGTSLDCTNCHGASLNSPIAASLNAAVTTRRPITTEFNNTWSHKRSAGGTVTKWDCIVCHMEGDPDSGQADFDYHGNGYIELRDPDTGSTIKSSTYSMAAGQSTTGPGRFVEGTTDVTFVRFSRNLNSTNPEADADWATLAAIQNNLCLKCHDSNGAMSSLAQVPGGTALKPFATTITNQGTPMPSYMTAGNVVNVFTSFSSGAASYHPVRHRANNSYIKNAMLNTGYKLATDKTGTSTTAYGLLITCWDCHAAAGASATQTSTVTAHGGAATLRSPIRAGGTTGATNLCIVCHLTTYSSTSTFHPAGSAFGSGSNSAMNATTFANCHYCHAYSAVNATVAAYAGQPRPLRGEDVHGVNERLAGTASSKWATTNAKPFAFFRAPISTWRPSAVVTANNDGVAIAGTASTCAGASGTCNNAMGVYAVGGTY